MALVSVVIAVFNGAATVGRAIDSALAQTGSVDNEIVVVDDGSTDDTPDIVKAYGSRVRLIRQSNQGAGAARNAGVAACAGDLLAFLDADDTWMPAKLSTMVRALICNSRAVLIYSDAVEVDEHDGELAASIVASSKAHAPSLAELLADWWPILPSTAIIRRATFAACGGFPPALRAYEDPYLFLRARELGEFIYVPAPLTRYQRLPVGDRMEKYAPYQELFIAMLRERYGRAAHARIKATRLAHTVALSHQGMLALQRGEPALARGSFARALRNDPTSIRTAMRWLRTFLPPGLARALGGHTAQGASRRSSR